MESKLQDMQVGILDALNLFSRPSWFTYIRKEEVAEDSIMVRKSILE